MQPPKYAITKDTYSVKTYMYMMYAYILYLKNFKVLGDYILYGQYKFLKTSTRYEENISKKIYPFEK